MNSCLYEIKVSHARLTPVPYAFTNRMFMFYFDLDELDALSHTLKLFSRDRFNLYDFRDSDHLGLSGKTAKENVLEFVRQKGVLSTIGKVMLLTSVRTLGYLFNPVSFYFCFDETNRPVCVVPEVGNTFRELKPFLIGPEAWQGERFQAQQTKFYYISPFIDLDAVLDFDIHVPGERFEIRVSDLKDDRKFFLATMTGWRKPLNDRQLLDFTFRYPFVTLQVISMIHWHALQLYLKKVPHHRKEHYPELQREVQRVFTPR